LKLEKEKLSIIGISQIILESIKSGVLQVEIKIHKRSEVITINLMFENALLLFPRKWESINQLWQWIPVCTGMTILKYFGLMRQPPIELIFIFSNW